LSDIDIRPVQPAYEAQIRALSAQTQALHQDRLPHIFTDGGARQRDLLELIFNQDVTSSLRAFMALKGDTLAGYVLVIPDGADDAEQPVNAMIADICVEDAYQQQGIARALLAHCEAEKKRMGWESLHAQVWQGNIASHQLFTSAGYLAERTDYRLGTPSVPNEPAPKGAPLRWLMLLCILLAAACLALAFR
jgi:ribosomal protein S18 acetylase RimI-like enzyme